MGMERRDLPIQELRASSDGDQPTISWYPAVFDSLSEDLGGFREIVGRRAFTKTLQEHDIRALINHDNNWILGRNRADTLKLKADLRGLHAEVTPPDTQYTHDLLANIGLGNITAGSFGFETIRDDWREQDGAVVRELREVRLFDVSIVTYPAYLDADGISLRTAFAGLIDADDLMHPLYRLRAGLPLEDDVLGRYQAALERLRALPAGPPDAPAPKEPDKRLAEFERTIQRLRALPIQRSA